MASCSKKPRTVEIGLETDKETYKLSKEVARELAVALDCLCYRSSVTLRPLKIINSNAANTHGIPFSKAFCDVDGASDVFLFGDIFRRAIDFAVDFVADSKIPETRQEKYILQKLLHFISTSCHQDILKKLDGYTETELTTLLANHLFGRLSTSSQYIVDRNCVGKRKQKDDCVCGTPGCKLTGNFGDTGIGNGEVWHGNLDIIVNNELAVNSIDSGDCQVQVHAEDSEEKEKVEPDSPCGRSPVKVKLKTTNLVRNPQIIAETIVFSFLQKHRHPERDHFLTPCIGIGSSKMVVLFYDAEHDILLESSPIPLLEPQVEEHSPEKVNLTAILISWLVVNYKYLCTGLTDYIQASEKAEFKVQAKEKFEIYKNRLKFQNVGISVSAKRDLKYDRYYSSPYVNAKHEKLFRFITSCEK